MPDIPSAAELAGALAATALTLALFSRAWRPNAAFRWAAHLLLGLWAGYLAAIALRTVLWPGLLAPLRASPGQPWLWLILALICLLALRFTPSHSLRQAGLIPVGLLAGAGAALALAGALRGTLVPQILAVGQIKLLPGGPGWANTGAALLAALVTASILLTFRQHDAGEADRPAARALAFVGKIGYLALMIALGVLLATTAGARLTLLIDRVQYLVMLWSGLLGRG